MAASPQSLPDDFDLLSAIWILSCIDENPIITYRGIVARVGVASEADAKRLVQMRRELFRPGLLQSRLENWKAEMRAKRQRPGWMLEIADESERQAAIDKLSRDDVFRNQFRVEERAPKCPIETINWGLAHLDRLQKNVSEIREEKRRRWSAIILPSAAILSSLLVAVISVSFQWKTSADQKELKLYEVSFRPKQEVYTTFMSAFSEAVLATFSADETRALIEINRMESAYNSMEPFLNEEARQKAFHLYKEFSNFCTEQVRQPRIIGADAAAVDHDRFNKAANAVALFKYQFRNLLYSELFGRPPVN